MSGEFGGTIGRLESNGELQRSRRSCRNGIWSIRFWPTRKISFDHGAQMKGVILAGGTGSRLFPLTKVTNKHLLPVYDKPMIYYPLECMAKAGIDEVLLVTGGNNAGDFIRLLGNEREFGLKSLNYTYQDGAGGIAQALGLAEDFADGGSICLILGDNILEFAIKEACKKFRHQGQGAKILLSQVE